MSSDNTIRNLLSALDAIAEGCPIELHQDSIISVENPDFVEGERHDPRLVIDVDEVHKILRNLLIGL